MKSASPTISWDIRSHPMPRSSPSFSAAIGSTAPIDAAVTPSPKSKGGLRENERADDKQKLGTGIISFVEADNGIWRKHGKFFRANIVLADEGNGGNVFALSDSCAIERYYRVADRVLEQFLSSNIAERNELIESYLVGNRLFKFLSVVLPTHHQYFSIDPRLEELRNNSESQLMELLEYMEELELMIDELEYNRYILKDLTPSEPKVNTGGGNIVINGMLQEDCVADGNFSQRFSEIERIEDSNNDIIIASKPKMPTERIQKRPPEKLEECAAHHSNQRDDAYRKFQGGSVKVAVQAIEASHNKQACDSSSQHQILKQKVAAVVTASSNVERSTDSRRSIRSISSITARLGSLSSTDIDKTRSETFPNRSHMQFQEFSQNDSNTIISQGLFHDTPFQPNHPEAPKNSIQRKQSKQDVRPLHESPRDSLMSWDADFSQFNVFSSEKIQGDDFVGLKPKNTNIDLLFHDPCPRGKKQSESPKYLSKIKEPPVSYHRSVWGHSQAHAARLLSSYEGHEPNTNAHKMEVLSALSDCSSDIFHSLEDPGSKMKPVKTKIEERMERAMDPRNNPSKGKNLSTMVQYENSSVLKANPQRKLINQFRGCVRFLID